MNERSFFHWNARLWGALIVLCGVLFLDGLDVSMVGVALPSIRADLGLDPSSLQWIVSGYVLGYGGLLLLGGRFADLLGRPRVLLGALGVFVVASIVGGLVGDGTLLVATRFLKGAAAGFTAPASLSIITTAFPEGPARNRALSVYGGVRLPARAQWRRARERSRASRPRRCGRTRRRRYSSRVSPAGTSQFT